MHDVQNMRIHDIDKSLGLMELMRSLKQMESDNGQWNRFQSPIPD